MDNINNSNSKAKSSSKFNKIIVIPIIIIAILFCLLAFTGQLSHWFSSSQQPDVPPEDVLSTIESANTIVLNGDFDNVNLHGYLEVDGMFIGNLIEEGLFNSTYTFSSGDSDIMYIKIGGETAREGSSTLSYAAYDAGDNIMGYCEELLGPIHDGTETYANFFFDANKEQMPYFHLTTLNITRNDYEFLNYDAELLFDMSYDYDITNNVFEINFTKLTDDFIPAQDIIMMICDLEQELSSELS